MRARDRRRAYRGRRLPPGIGLRGDLRGFGDLLDHREARRARDLALRLGVPEVRRQDDEVLRVAAHLLVVARRRADGSGAGSLAALTDELELETRSAVALESRADLDDPLVHLAEDRLVP